MKKLLVFFAFALFTTSMYSQISVSGQLGWILPGGGGVGDGVNQYDVKGGLVYEVDALYHLNEDDPKLGVGVEYLGAILGGEGIITDNYGLTFYGIKGHYRLNPGGFSPYAGLSVGLATLATPEYTINGVTIASLKGSGLGLKLEAGLDIKGFLLGIDYMLPTGFKIEENGVTLADGSVGGLIISLGWRQSF